MARLHVTKFGLVMNLSHQEVTSISNNWGLANSSIATITALLAGLGIKGSAAALGGIAVALLNLGVAALKACNYLNKGVVITVIWKGRYRFWCRSQ